MQEIEVIEYSGDCDAFRSAVNSLLSNGYKIASTSCSIINSADYNFCSMYQAILVRETSDKRIKVAKPTTTQEVTSKEGLCYNTLSDEWLHEELDNEDESD